MVHDDRFADLLRHGSVVGGERFRGTTDTESSPAGLAQMRTATAGLTGWDAVFSSPSRRCVDFAREIAAHRGLEMASIPELAERGFGAWENLSAAEIPPDELGAFWKDPVGFTPPGAEPLADLEERVGAGWKRIIATGYRFPLLITHGGVIRVILGQVLGIPSAAWMRIEVPPACRTRLRVPAREGHPSLMYHGGPDPCGAPF